MTVVFGLPLTAFTQEMKSPIKKYLLILLAVYAVILLAACFWPFNFFQENGVIAGRDSLTFFDPGIAYTEKVGAGLGDLKEFTLVAELSAASPGHSSWIISYGLDFDQLNLLIGLYVHRLIVETHRGEQTMRASIEGAVQRGKRTWLVVVGSPGFLRVYVDGRLRREVLREDPDSTKWDSSYPLVIGARSDGKYPWSGTLYRLGILGFAVSEEQATNPDSLLTSSLAMSYQFQSGEGWGTLNRGTGETGLLYIPELFVPFRRASLMDIEDLWIPKPIWTDIILNVLAFVPLGILLCFFLRKAFHPLVVVLLVLIAAFGLSLCIEMLQVYLPRRWSTFTDVATNSIGALLGAITWLLGAGSQIGRKLKQATAIPPDSSRDVSS